MLSSKDGEERRTEGRRGGASKLLKQQDLLHSSHCQDPWPGGLAIYRAGMLHLVPDVVCSGVTAPP